MCLVSDYRGQTYTNQMNGVLEKKPQMMMVVIPNNKSDLYSITKKLCCVQNPCPTQVMTGSLLRKGKGLGSIALKVAIQMACKLGAEPWIVKLPNIAGLMIIGKFDIRHAHFLNFSRERDMDLREKLANVDPALPSFSRFLFQNWSILGL